MKANDARVVFEDITHDPEFKYRLLKGTQVAPVHVNAIYKIMYPGSYTVYDPK